MSKPVLYIGVSGGVDSAVALDMLQKEGIYDIKPVFLKCYDESTICTTDKDISDAISICSKLNLKLQIWDERETYKKFVLQYFFDSYNLGLTPNPDVMCNQVIKFGVFADKSYALHKNSKIATGHYAQILSIKDLSKLSPNYSQLLKARPLGQLFLAEGVDKLKDQSYFLYRICANEDLLKRCVFKLGRFKKSEIRRYAKKVDMPVADKKDSYGICFVGDVKLFTFVKNNAKFSNGNVVDIDGLVIGTHKGLNYYTIGQRHGFVLNKQPSYAMYVINKVTDRNVLVVGPRQMAYKKTFFVKDAVFIKFNESTDTVLELISNLSVRIRHLGEKNACEVKFLGDGLFQITPQKSLFGVAPGQSAVVYFNDIIIGGGIIS